MMNIVELFAGIGGLTQGFVKAGGFESALLTDISEVARTCYWLNFPASRYEPRDIRHLSGRDLLELSGRKIQGILGCPPCQGWSSVGTRNPRDGRNRLVHDFFRLVAELQPDFFFFENVPQVYRQRGFQRLMKHFAEYEGYATWCRVANAAMFGAPQTRQRVILVGCKSKGARTLRGPKPTHWGRKWVYEYASGRMLSPTGPHGAAIYAPYPGLEESTFWTGGKSGFKHLRGLGDLLPLVTVGDALDDLGRLDERNKSYCYDEKLEPSAYVRSLRNGSSAVLNHEGWNHRPETVRMMGQIRAGGARFAGRGTGRSERYFSQAYARLHPRGLARTVTSQFHNAGCGRFIHYDQPRTLTVREAGRLQGLDDEFILVGGQTQTETLVGNAFPVPWATAMAKYIKGTI